MLSKLDQVMPGRLRSQVSAVHEATVTLAPQAESPVRPEVLMTLARACRDHEHVEADYTDRAGATTQRRLEPYQLVTTGRRWYLLAYDRDRTDWRSLRLDRMASVRARGSRFTPRQAPDAASYVRKAISASPYRYLARVRYNMPEETVAQYFSAASASVEPDGDNACVVTAGGDDPERMVLYFAMVGAEFEVLEPPEVITAARAVSVRLQRAAALLTR
jgi:predicted DNA-binding transcriptional regulator YafY